MTEVAVRVSALVKGYAGTRVLDIAELEFAPGRIHVMVGPNGAGKTTLLRILNCIETPDEGGVFVLCRDLAALSGSARLSLQRRMAFSAQKPYLFRTSVRQNVDYPLRVRGVGGNECTARAREAMEKLGVAHLAERFAGTLSAGEVQRVSLARAVVSEPELLLLDEPLANVDPEGVPLIEAVLRDLASSGVTVIVATHELGQAYRLSANVVRLEHGRLAPPAIENLLEGEVIEGPDGSGAVLSLACGCRIAVATEKRGRVRAAIDPRDIVISDGKLVSSARNSLSGRVTSLRERERLVFLTVDIGIELTAAITPESVRTLRLTVGSQVFLTFKAATVEVF